MFLQRLQLINFKNYPAAEMELLPTMNCFTGNNGAGKTNILDAIALFVNVEILFEQYRQAKHSI